MKTEISGELVKIAFANEVDILLGRGSPVRPAARFNRLGQDALYLSVNEESARVAMKKYATESDSPRCLVRYEIKGCSLVDLRHPDAVEMHSLASQDWQAELAKGVEPSSWRVSDYLRKVNEAGLIDPSRKNPLLWHVTLFRWNDSSGPCLKMLGRPEPISI